MINGFTIWLTGLSGSGKSTIAAQLHKELCNLGIKPVEVFDGDVIWQNLSKGLGFSKEDQDINIERIGWVCELLSRDGIPNITAAISPYRETRNKVRSNINKFVEVYVFCPINVLIKRDTKGLYRKAIDGEIKNFTGMSAPYEEPLSPEVKVDTSKETVDESVKKIINKLKELGYLANYVYGDGI